jgi:hypothetical protein
MRFSKILLFAAALALLPFSCGKKEYAVKGNTVTVKLEIPGQAGNDEVRHGRPDRPSQIRLQVLGEKLIRVSATPDKKFNDRKSLVVLPQKADVPFQVSMEEGFVKVSYIGRNRHRRPGHRETELHGCRRQDAPRFRRRRADDFRAHRG